MIEELTNLQNIIAAIGLLLVLMAYTILIYYKGNELWSGIKGKDGKLDIPEMVVLVWFIIFPIAFFIDLYFVIPATFWYILQSIVLFALTGRVFLNEHPKKEIKKGQD